MELSRNHLLETSWTRLENVLNADGTFFLNDSRPRTTASTRKNVKSHRFPVSISSIRSNSISKSCKNRIKRTVTQSTSMRRSQVMNGINMSQILMLYTAKCQDLEIPVLNDQEKRFFNYATKHFVNRKFSMREAGIGKKCAKAIGEILEDNPNFAYVDLGKNLLTDEGAVTFLRKILKSIHIVHLDLSSNEISAEGSETILNLLQDNPSLMSLDLSSHEGFHRNRLALKGSMAVEKLLNSKSVLAVLNLSGTGIGPEGLEFVLKGLRNNFTLAVLDLSNNNLAGKCFEGLARAVSLANLQELDISSNKIGNEGCEYISMMLSGAYQSYCTVVKLNLCNGEISTDGLSKLFAAMRVNTQVSHLNLKKNDFSQGLSDNLSQFFEENAALQWLDLSGCSIYCEGLVGIDTGLAKNNGIKHLSMSSNFISDEGIEKIASALKRNEVLKVLDLSHNKIKDSGGVILAKALQMNESLCELYLKNNSLKDETAQLLCDYTRNCHSILKLGLDLNPISFRYLEIIKTNLKANHEFQHKSLIPKLQENINKIQFRESAIDELNEMILEKKMEKAELENKLKSKEDKLEEAKNAEIAKFEELKNQYKVLRELSLKLSSEIEELYSQINVKNN